MEKNNSILTERALREALARMEQRRPAPPAGMEERFMARLERQRAAARKRRRRIALYVSGAVATAAAVALFVLPQWRTAEKPAQPGIADVRQTGGATVPPKPAPVAPQEHPTATDAPAQRATHRAPARIYNMYAPPLATAATGGQEAQAATESAPTEQPTNLPHPAEMPAAEAAATAQADAPDAGAAEDAKAEPTFTPHELALMARAELMRPQTRMYTAELLQCARVEERESILAQREAKRHRQRTITTNI